MNKQISCKLDIIQNNMSQENEKYFSRNIYREVS